MVVSTLRMSPAIHGPSRPDGSIPLRGSTTIEVRRVNNMYQLSQMRRCVMAAKGSSVGRVREGRGDCGEMMVVGTRRSPTAQDGEQYALTRCLDGARDLRECLLALEEVGSEVFPGLQCVMRDMERDAGNICRCPCVGRKTVECAPSQDYSVNLANASHYDPNDASKGFAVWMEEGAGSGGYVPDMHGWYFVFPNVMVTEERKSGQRKSGGEGCCGLAIKLCHGVAIAWDGMELCHSTSLAERYVEAKRTEEVKQMRGRCGIFVAAKRQTVSSSSQSMGGFA